MSSNVGSFRGTTAEQDPKYANRQRKLMNQMRFEDCLSVKVSMDKVNVEVLKPWIAQRITKVLGAEDEVVIEYAFSLLECPVPNAKEMQMNLTGFLNAKRSREFMGELWAMLVAAQETDDGIAPQLVDMKITEMTQYSADVKPAEHKGERRDPLKYGASDSQMSRNANMEPLRNDRRANRPDNSPPPKSDDREPRRRRSPSPARRSSPPRRERREMSPLKKNDDEGKDTKERDEEREKEKEKREKERALRHKENDEKRGAVRERRRSPPRRSPPRRRRSPSPRRCEDVRPRRRFTEERRTNRNKRSMSPLVKKDDSPPRRKRLPTPVRSRSPLTPSPKKIEKKRSVSPRKDRSMSRSQSPSPKKAANGDKSDEEEVENVEKRGSRQFRKRAASPGSDDDREKKVKSKKKKSHKEKKAKKEKKRRTSSTDEENEETVRKLRENALQSIKNGRGESVEKSD